VNTTGSLPNLTTTHPSPLTRHAEVIGVRENLVTIEAKESHIIKNEVAYVCVGNQRLKAEVLRIHGTTADLQVYEETYGIAIGQRVDLTGEMLSVTLSPGLLGQVFDGLQNPLPVLAQQHGFFLPRGIYANPVDLQRKWTFTPMASIGATLRAGEVIGTVQEGRFTHKIMVPFNEMGPVTVDWIHEGNCTANTKVARISGADGRNHDVTMIQRWPIRRSLPEAMLRKQLVERIYPSEPLITSIRLIDTFFPIARGGTACIPGPFGAGKTVLQSLIARFSNIDIVIIVACGERAGEVVETITEFPNLADPRTGGSLMDRTIIICNTSSMPVAARESSIYTGMTLGEYFRQMGYHVLVIADSTSRWAQAIRETSGRMEEIPGEEAFPAYLDSNIKSIYERAGVIRCPDGSIGSVTMIGTVSPAGGNFEEPVTQSTLSTVKTFLGLSSDRAYRRFYPAVDPLISWSRYSNQLQPWYEAHLDSEWSEQVQASLGLLKRGDAVYQMMQVTGEEGISLEDYVTWQKAKFLDMVYVQQDAFDEVDSSTSLDRQKESFQFIRMLLEKDYQFANREEAREFFTRLTDLYKNLNYSHPRSDEYNRYQEAIETLTNQFLFLMTKE
jgi:V/A-type H+/Na+-transporting ATPase subunit A